jgi:hypothetical protein
MLNAQNPEFSCPAAPGYADDRHLLQPLKSEGTLTSFCS